MNRFPLLPLAALVCALPLAACGAPEDALDDTSPLTLTAASCRGAPYPIVLAHGMAGFERIGWLNYFFNVAADLRSRGETVVAGAVPPYDSSAVRATHLARIVDDTLRDSGACRVNVIAHSQGGLDTRYLISTLGYGAKIASLTTVSTPHRGSPVADVALGLVPGFSYGVVNALLELLYGPGRTPGDARIQASLSQLARDNMISRFNPANRDDSRVRYYSVAGRSALRVADADCGGALWPNSSRVDVLDPLLAATEVVFAATSPNPFVPIPNDGLVSVTSARWGTFLGCVPADHLDEVGQIGHLLPDVVSGFSHKDLYRRIVTQLHKDGF